MIIKIRIATIFILSIVLYLNSYSQNNLNNQQKQLFDFDWKFKLGETENAEKTNFNDSDWRILDLPHDWSIEGQVSFSNPGGNDGGYFPTGTGWYRKNFSVPDDLKNKKISVYFEGVYMNSEVFINGKTLGLHPYGYSSFEYDLTPFIKFGENNTIAVHVDNSQQKNCRWYSGSGIYRHVWLRVTDPVHMDHWGVFVTTPFVSDKKATVNLQTWIKNETSENQTVSISAQLIDKYGKLSKNEIINLQIPANSSKHATQDIIVKSPKLWSPETPEMYSAIIKIQKEGQTIDETSIPFGIRSIKFTAENGFELNGKKVLINGGCVHHDNGCLGAAAYDRAEERKVELLKAAGFNAVRTSHNVPSEAFLNACDKLGLLVIDEAFDGWKTEKTPHDYSKIFEEWSEKDITSMVKRDRNHPSIIMWSIGNEIIERKEPQAVETAKTLAGYVKKQDQTRPVTSAMTTWDEDWEIFDPLMAAHDVCGYNYTLNKATDDHKRVPSRIIVQTESYPRDAYANWKLVSENPYIIGDFVWTAIDYLGESGIGRTYYSGEVTGEHWERPLFPWHGAYCGDIDLIGRRKPISHYRSQLYNPSESIYMAVREPEPLPIKINETMWSVWPTRESWTWPGFEEKDIQVEVYTKYPKVRLYLNDKLMEEKDINADSEFKAVFTLPYTQGTLKAVGVENDKEMESCTLTTATEAAIITAKTDANKIAANGQSLAFISIDITDANNVLQPNASNLLEFSISGPGMIIGVDNGNVKDTDPYRSKTRKAWHGKALVIVKSVRNKEGMITLHVNSKNLKSASVQIESSNKP